MATRIELDKLKVEYLVNSNFLAEIWKYHPSNPIFVNPIKAYNEVNDILAELGRKIELLEREINYLN
tara:strand:+ start:328 stop:528 length:201 start_codon:yes stop_codon:yes gene_type:complete